MSAIEKKSFIAITVFNRKEITLRCLKRLRDLDIFEWATAVVVDDASTDGTWAAIRSEFDEQDVVLLQGSGDLWWGGGTNMAMEYAYDCGAENIFWLNDDCLVEEGVLETLKQYSTKNKCISIAKAVTAGGRVYAGDKKSWRGLTHVSIPLKKNVEVDAINGNCVCIPRFIVSEVGFIDSKHFPHYRGDSDYSLRAKKRGIDSVVVEGIQCENEDNIDLGAGDISWLLTEESLMVLWKLMGTKKSSCYFPMHYSFFIRHWGAWGVFLATIPFVRFWLIWCVRLVIPRSVLIKLWGKRSIAHQISTHYKGNNEA